MIVVAVVGLLALLLISGSSGTGANAASQTLISCGAGIPAVKCNPSLAPGPNPVPVGGWQVPSVPTVSVPTTEQCASSFLSSTELGLLNARFGGIQCFLIKSSSTWVIFGAGTSMTSLAPNTPSPGGSMLAIETCASTNANCLDPNLIHSFADFTVYYPPFPGSGQSTLQELISPTLINVYNGFCGNFIFDTANSSWYLGNAVNESIFRAGGQVTGAVVTPPSVSGSTAEGSPFPAEMVTSCQTPAQ